ncbi:MAG: hypothetical protein WBP13_08750 [Methylophilaceae bacterium]
MQKFNKNHYLVLVAGLLLLNVNLANSEPKKPTKTLNVDERYQYQLLTSIPEACVSADFSTESNQFLTLFSRVDLKAVAARPKSGHDAPLALIARAEQALASLTDKKDSLGCYVIPKEKLNDLEYLVLSMVEEEKAAIYDKNTAKFEPTATVHYSSGSCCFGMIEIGTPSNPFLFLLSWWVS